VTNRDPDAHPVDCVLFDLYGTLLDIQVDEDSAALWAGLTTALRSRGARVDPGGLRDRFLSILKEEGQRGREGFIMELVFQRLLTSLGVTEDIGRVGRLFRQLSLKELTLRPYVTPLLEALRRSGSQTGIVSNTEAILTCFDLDRFSVLLTVGTIVLSSDVGVRKPDPQIFHLALERLHAEPASAVFIGNDWAEDIVGARRIGLRAIYLHERACDCATVATKADGAVLHVTPTLEAIVSALRECGWNGGEL
jgi:haloacid dehalogenase superfamily, subfamily IA, variant 3 with third motif having DD or ED/haloacid dehalogenase superfamily, subfamily IA, variant 1 with third motif having Dx(3-4)D or Dx(3-4)E